MKRIAIWIVVVLFFLILVGLFVFKLLAPTTPEQTPSATVDPFANNTVTTQQVYTDTPYRTAVSCYSWYVRAFATTATLEDIRTQPQAKQCFTPELLSNWSALAERSGSDPVLQAQDYLSSWTSSITADTIGQSIKVSDQRVTLGSGDSAQVVTAHILQQEDDTWKIDSVTR